MRLPGWCCGAGGSARSDFIPDRPTVNRLERGRAVDFRGSCRHHGVCSGVKKNSKSSCDDQLFNERKALHGIEWLVG